MVLFDRKDDYYFLRWASEVKQRDHWTCQICGRRGGDLNSHHLNSWNAYPDERYNIPNGITLCALGNKLGCHNIFHQIYGKGNNTKEQFEEFEQLYGELIKTAIAEDSVERTTKQVIKLLDGYDLANKIAEDLDRETGKKND